MSEKKKKFEDLLEELEQTKADINWRVFEQEEKEDETPDTQQMLKEARNKYKILKK